MLARVKFQSTLRKFFKPPQNYYCLKKLILKKAGGYGSSLKGCGYFKLAKQSLTLQQKDDNVVNYEESLKLKNERRCIFGLIFGILLITVRIFVIFFVTLALLTIYCVARACRLREPPVIYLKGKKHFFILQSYSFEFLP